ncbi:trypsin-like peptidase domain-containing protein [Moraxella sp. Tifton1]|uniref:S1C family serine protease n=1 Tax=Moraxella oculi TaxID=2940516 RepID=UPI0020128507|nr:trypsin-like peptidase domain-containing protein [Moraxella sp. Tifton1]MCL1622809.1 trypsin-like peptidase domain-containing protein [Moraxella sp. Tifton1]
MNKLTKISTKKQQGISFWIILPWIITMMLVAVLCWTFLYHTPNNTTLTPSMTGQKTWVPPTADANRLSTPAVSSYKDAVSHAAKSVVNIYTTQTIKHPYMNDPVLNELFERYYGRQNAQQGANLGSGVIVSKDGYIVTNAHVVSQADDIIVALNDGRKTHAKIIGSDEDSDLAVIKVDLHDLEPLTFRSQPINVGDVALAIGNPFGVGQTVTQGIISATGRTGLGVSSFEDFIQTDAAINPGNSGGALVDANGDLIGINTVIYSRSGGSMGIGFAIPTSIIEQVMNALITHGKVSRGWLGVGIAQMADDPVSLEPSQGVLVTQVWKNTPAEQAGMKAGDIITSLDDMSISNANTLTGIIAKHTPNTRLKAGILRDGKPLTLTVTLGERPSRTQD